MWWKEEPGGCRIITKQHTTSSYVSARLSRSSLLFFPFFLLSNNNKASFKTHFFPYFERVRSWPTQLTSYIFTISCSLNWSQLWTLFLLFPFIPFHRHLLHFHMCEMRTQSVTVSASSRIICVCSSLENSITWRLCRPSMTQCCTVDSCVSREFCYFFFVNNMEAWLAVWKMSER